MVSKNTKSVESDLHTKRNDQRLNLHNRVMLKNWRANVDLQVIVDEKACARYMAKYAAKGEPRNCLCPHYRMMIKSLRPSRKQ